MAVVGQVYAECRAGKFLRSTRRTWSGSLDREWAIGGADRPRQGRLTGEPGVHPVRAGPTLGDGPDDEGLALSLIHI